MMSEQHILLLYEQLDDDLLVAHLVEGGQGLLVRGVHESGPEHDPQVLRIHQVVLLMHGHPGRNTSAQHTYKHLVSITNPAMIPRVVD